MPEPDGKPGAVARFFRSLSAGQQQRLADRYPLVVGNLGGAPAKLRYHANHKAPLDARDVERERMTDERLTDDGRRSASLRMHRSESLLEPGRQILARSGVEGEDLAPGWSMDSRRSYGCCQRRPSSVSRSSVMRSRSTSRASRRALWLAR